jgi:hypothetical protein
MAEIILECGCLITNEWTVDIGGIPMSCVVPCETHLTKVFERGGKKLIHAQDMPSTKLGKLLGDIDVEMVYPVREFK